MKVLISIYLQFHYLISTLVILILNEFISKIQEHQDLNFVQKHIFRSIIKEFDDLFIKSKIYAKYSNINEFSNLVKCLFIHF